MEIGPLKDGYKVETPQSNSENVPRLPMRVVALGPSSSGKSNLLVTLLTDDFTQINSKRYIGDRQQQD